MTTLVAFQMRVAGSHDFEPVSCDTIGASHLVQGRDKGGVGGLLPVIVYTRKAQGSVGPINDRPKLSTAIDGIERQVIGCG
jgi:hypothetical protein